MQNTMNVEKCETCLKPAQFCFCGQVPEMATQLKLVVLQHPQEPKELLSTIPLMKSVLKDIVIKIGLSWPNFKKSRR